MKYKEISDLLKNMKPGVIFDASSTDSSHFYLAFFTLLSHDRMTHSHRYSLSDRLVLTRIKKSVCCEDDRQNDKRIMTWVADHRPHNPLTEWSALFQGLSTISCLCEYNNRSVFSKHERLFLNNIHPSLRIHKYSSENNIREGVPKADFK